MKRRFERKGEHKILTDRLTIALDGYEFTWSTSAEEVQEVLEDFTEVWGEAYDRDPYSDLSSYCGIAVLRLSSVVDRKLAGENEPAVHASRASRQLLNYAQPGVSTQRLG